MKRLFYSDAAVVDPKSILDYIAQDKPRTARSFVDVLIEQCHLIAENSEMGMWRDKLAPL